jgi:hypothetical protein
MAARIRIGCSGWEYAHRCSGSGRRAAGGFPGLHPVEATAEVRASSPTDLASAVENAGGMADFEPFSDRCPHQMQIRSAVRPFRAARVHDCTKAVDAAAHRSRPSPPWMIGRLPSERTTRSDQASTKNGSSPYSSSQRRRIWRIVATTASGGVPGGRSDAIALRTGSLPSIPSSAR